MSERSTALPPGLARTNHCGEAARSHAPTYSAPCGCG